MIYLDTSALIKRYIWESGSEYVLQIYKGNATLDGFVKSPFCPIFVIPAKAGIQLIQAVLDSCFRRSDGFSDFLRDHHSCNFQDCLCQAYAAFTRRMREGHLPPIRYSRVCRLFEREWPAYLTVEVRDEVLRLSRDLIKKYPLRGFDALHLASAKSLWLNLRTPITFACADQRLLESAKAESLELLGV